MNTSSKINLEALGRIKEFTSEFLSLFDIYLNKIDSDQDYLNLVIALAAANSLIQAHFRQLLEEDVKSEDEIDLILSNVNLTAAQVSKKVREESSKFSSVKVKNTQLN